MTAFLPFSVVDQLKHCNVSRRTSRIDFLHFIEMYELKEEFDVAAYLASFRDCSTGLMTCKLSVRDKE